MNERALGVYLTVALAAWLAAHVALVVRAFRDSVRRGFLALALPPLAPFYAWEAGESRLAVAWVAALVAYGIGLGLA